MKVRLLVGSITVIMTAISILLFHIAGIISAAHPALSALCIVSGGLLIIPLILFAVLSVTTHVHIGKKR